MVTVAGKIGCGFSGVALVVRVGAVGEEEFGQILPVGCGGREEGSESSGLGGVGVGAVHEQEVDCLHVATEGEGGMERLVLLGVAAESFDTGSGGEKDGDGFGGSESGSEVEGGPTIAGKRIGAGGRGLKQSGQLGHVWDGGSFKDIQFEELCFEDGDQEVADEGLAAVDGPEES